MERLGRVGVLGRNAYATSSTNHLCERRHWDATRLAGAIGWMADKSYPEMWQEGGR
jgi:hypothetical protein